MSEEIKQELIKLEMHMEFLQSNQKKMFVLLQSVSLGIEVRQSSDQNLLFTIPANQGIPESKINLRREESITDYESSLPIITGRYGFVA